MTIFNKATLATFFAQGDIPQGSDYNNLIQSQVNLAETVEQDMAGPLSTTKLITPKVSAAALNVTGAVTFGSVSFAGVVSAASVNVTGDIRATSGTVYASALNSTSGLISSPVIISAAGTALATATQLTAYINRIQGVVDAQNTGVKLLVGTGRLGWEQTIVNETAVSANLWPAGSDFKINALASGAAFAMAANTTYFAVYTQASAYAVK